MARDLVLRLERTLLSTHPEQYNISSGRDNYRHCELSCVGSALQKQHETPLLPELGPRSSDEEAGWRTRRHSQPQWRVARTLS